MSQLKLVINFFEDDDWATRRHSSFVTAGSSRRGEARNEERLFIERFDGKAGEMLLQFGSPIMHFATADGMIKYGDFSFPKCSLRLSVNETYFSFGILDWIYFFWGGMLTRECREVVK